MLFNRVILHLLQLLNDPPSAADATTTPGESNRVMSLSRFSAWMWLILMEGGRERTRERRKEGGREGGRDGGVRGRERAGRRE